jgi:hypothetical protein
MKIACIVSPLHDMLTANIIEGLEELGHKIWKFDPSADTDRLRGIWFSLVIEFSNRDVDSSITNTYDWGNSPIIYINGEDFLDDHPYNIEWKCFRKPDRYKLYFRREMLPWYKKQDHEYPLPFGVYPKYLEHYNEEKNGESIFPSSGEYPNRREIIRYIQENQLPVKVGRIGQFRHSITPHATDDYYEVLNSSSVIISSLGWGQDTARFWEAIATGACVISERIDILMENPFTHMENVIFFDHPSELVQIFKDIKEGRIDTKKIGERGREFALEHHMIKNRAKYVLDKVLEYNLLSSVS